MMCPHKKYYEYDYYIINFGQKFDEDIDPAKIFQDFIVVPLEEPLKMEEW